VNSEFEEPDSILFNELRLVMGDAYADFMSESRLDMDYEVAETVRYEQGQISWRDRTRTSDCEIEVFLAHPELPRVTGSLASQSSDFLILKSHLFQYLVNSNFVSAVRGLHDLATINTQFDSVSWLENVWFHDLCDRIVEVNWYLVSGQVMQGHCIRSGFDAVDISGGDSTFTIPKSAIVAARVPILG
jgi:hypothetical protein